MVDFIIALLLKCNLQCIDKLSTNRPKIEIFQTIEFFRAENESADYLRGKSERQISDDKAIKAKINVYSLIKNTDIYIFKEETW